MANQIAAGEVVERPASVVKELVENALDARATRVEVSVERGGKTLIRVADDGVGMGREDALLSLDRHATSKIERAEDLGGVRSFGFRGEALPSIAAVSRLSLETRDIESEAGTAVRVNPSGIVGIEDFARQRGTTVTVHNLFFNAPARAKFLKAVAAESRAISEAVVTLSLSHPSVGFTLISDGETRLELPRTGDVVSRIAAIWGEDAASALVPLEHVSDGLEVLGLVQRPDAARPGLRRAYLYVGGRPFRDAPLIRSAHRGYRTTIPERARPWMFLYLEAPKGSVDVNVHPSKTEVRFRDRASVEALLEAAVVDALAGEASGASFDAQIRAPVMSVRERPSARHDSDAAAQDPQTALFVAGLQQQDPSEGPHGAASASGLDTGEPAALGLWQVHRTYVFAESRDGLLIIDQHSAHERVLFARLMSAFAEGGQTSQRLLFPLTLRLTREECRRIEELDGLLSRAGFEIEGFGGDTVIVNAVPDPHPYFDAERCFREMIAELTLGSALVSAAKNQHEKIAMTFACKGAIKAGQRLTETEMRELLDALFATELPYHDVHGRPTIVRLSKGELERKFGR